MDDDRLQKIMDKYKGEARFVIQILMDIQHANGWLPREVMEKVSKRLDVPLSEIMHMVTFYKTFSLMPKARHEIHVCTGSSCHVRGSQAILDKVEELIGIRPGETSSDLKFSLEAGNCLGCCSLGPEIIVDGQHHSRIEPDRVEDVLKEVD
jgi:NADH-quinone oxidoreductase subunit E